MTVRGVAPGRFANDASFSFTQLAWHPSPWDKRSSLIFQLYLALIKKLSVSSWLAMFISVSSQATQ